MLYDKINDKGLMINHENGKARPTLYFKTDVKITGGDGTSSNPYILGI